MGDSPHLNLSPPHSVEIDFSPFPTCSLTRTKKFSTIFHNDLNMCFVYPFPMGLEFTKNDLSPDEFSYVFCIQGMRILA